MLSLPLYWLHGKNGVSSQHSGQEDFVDQQMSNPPALDLMTEGIVISQLTVKLHSCFPWLKLVIIISGVTSDNDHNKHILLAVRSDAADFGFRAPISGPGTSTTFIHTSTISRNAYQLPIIYFSSSYSQVSFLLASAPTW
jgi:hypothetical protein